MSSKNKVTAERYHDFCSGHTVTGHESKCAHLHGHNYRAHFTVAGELDSVGRVLDFSVIKIGLCAWLEENWDHRFLVFKDDPRAPALQVLDRTTVVVGFNPTAENMAKYLVEVVGPEELEGTGCTLIHVKLEETRKCAASYGSR